MSALDLDELMRLAEAATEGREALLEGAPDETDCTAADVLGNLAEAVPALVERVRELEKERDQARELCAAAAQDYDRVAAKIREAAIEGLLPKTLKDMDETSALMKRAATGEIVWPVYQSELGECLKAGDAKAARIRELELRVQELEAERARIDGGEAMTRMRHAAATAQARVTELEEALRPFAIFARVFDGHGVRGTWVQFDLDPKWPQVSVQDWRGRGDKKEWPDETTLVTVVEEVPGGNGAMPWDLSDFRRARSALNRAEDGASPSKITGDQQ